LASLETNELQIPDKEEKTPSGIPSKSYYVPDGCSCKRNSVAGVDYQLDNNNDDHYMADNFLGLCANKT
jgi:hypothetical protein